MEISDVVLERPKTNIVVLGRDMISRCDLVCFHDTTEGIFVLAYNSYSDDWAFYPQIAAANTLYVYDGAEDSIKAAIEDGRRVFIIRNIPKNKNGDK